MTHRKPVEPITASDEEIRAALEEAELPPLLATLAHLTGDESLLREDLALDPMQIGEPQGGWTDEQQAEVRALAQEILSRHRDAGSPLPPAPSEALLTRIMTFTTGTDAMREYVLLLEEELSITGQDLRAPTWKASDLGAPDSFRVLIIGAGMSGLLAAYRLQQVGIDFEIVEKDPDVGGTWFENIYPGCRVDNPNHNYSYSFAQRHDWPFHYSTQDVLQRYFAEFADEHDLRRHVRFDTEVVAARWSDEDRVWTVDVRGSSGEARIEANVVISAVGQLNQPLFPDIPGLDEFEGESFHSARWRPDVDLRGKRVAVVGTGASAMQFIPVVAEEASELFVFQRTPAWLIPTPEYHDPVPDGLKWLYAHVPFYSEWNRFWIFWRMGDGALLGAIVDPAWKGDEEAVSEANAMMRELALEYLRSEFADAPDLLEKVTPHYPITAKRMIRDNGIWASTLKRPDVHLMTEGIERITPRGIVCGRGIEHPVDVILYGTGFQASRFLTPMRITGRDGTDLHERWQGDDARAYLGLTVPGFPNFFMLYGPNTNIVINGSIVYFSECGVRYILDAIRLLLEEGARALDLREEVHENFNEAVDAANRGMTWGASSVNSWYKNSKGRSAQNWPFTLLEYWRRTKQIDAKDYTLS